MHKPAVTLILLLAAAPFPGMARQDPQACGTHSLRSREEMFLHRRSAARQPVQSSGLARAASSSGNRDSGQIAVVEDSGGVVGRRNPFNLAQKTLAFLPTSPAASSYRFQLGGSGYDQAAASSGTLKTLKDDDSQLAPLPFAFPFFGSVYRQIYVNSDGNLTLGSGDSTSADRSLGRLTSGLARIAPLFTDLDPSSSAQGVFVTAEPERFVVSWVSVPLYSTTGRGVAQTFQVRLFPDGKIEMAWSQTNVADAVVGISPGGLQVAPAVLSFVAGSSQSFAGAVAERFSGSDAVDIVTTAQRFYQTHEDAYDYLVIFNGEGVPAGPSVVAYEVTARNSRTGYGDDLVDDGAEYGSNRRLQSVLNMGPLSQYPADPNAVVPARGTTGDTPLTVLGHESGHLFLAFASVMDPNNPKAPPMLGRSLVHWSFLFNSEASLLEGNRIQDNGASAIRRFTTTATVEGYAPLDQYLMGFRAPGEVPPTFVVLNSPQISDPGRPPQKGIAFDGTRRDIAIEELAAVSGRRTPDSTVAQRRFRFAFILIVPAGSTPNSTPDSTQIATVEAYRSGFEAAYDRYTSGRAVAEASLKRAVQFSAFPAAGVLVGSPATAVIALERPAAADLAILIRSDAGLVSAPPSVTIPAGASSAKFTLNGLRPGVDQLTLEPADSSYETAVAKVQAAGSAASLILKSVAGGGQAAVPGQALSSDVVLKVTDVNELPYSGVLVRATVSGGGSADPQAISDEGGLVRFRWVPGSGPINELTASLPGGPSITVAALGLPQAAAENVVNAASFAPGLSPGAIATLFGSNLLGASVSVNGAPTQVFYADNRQINFLAPDGLTGPEASLMVRNVAGVATIDHVPVVGIQPGIFAAVNRGGYLEIYATGLGPVAGQSTVNTPQVTLGGVDAKVLFSGFAPGFPGLYQVNAAVPDGVGGSSPVYLSVLGKQSNTVQPR